MAAFLGMRGTGDFTVNGQRPENWRQMILKLYPNGKAPLTALMSMMKSERTDDPVFHWFEKELATQSVAPTGVYTDVLSTAYVSGATAGTVLYFKMAAADVANFKAGHVVLLRDASNLTVDCIGRVGTPVANGANSYIPVTLLEADDNGSGNDLSDCDTILIIGTAHPEGDTASTAIAYDPAEKSNYTQIFRSALDITRTAAKTRLRTGDSVTQAKAEALELHSIEMERAFFFGLKYAGTGSNGKPLRTTQGIRRYLSTNVSNYTTQAGTATWLAGGEAWLEAQLEQLFRHGSTEKIAFCGSGALLGLNQLAKAGAVYQMSAKEVSYGIRVIEWITAFGTLYLKTHPLLTMESTLRNTMAILDTDNILYRYVDDTKYMPKIQANDLDGEKSEYLTEAGLELHFEKSHGWLEGVGLDNP